MTALRFAFLLLFALVMRGSGNCGGGHCDYGGLSNLREDRRRNFLTL
jgi:hypothetical protein